MVATCHGYLFTFRSIKLELGSYMFCVWIFEWLEIVWCGCSRLPLVRGGICQSECEGQHIPLLSCNSTPSLTHVMFHCVQPRVLVLSRPGIPDPAEVSHRKCLAGVLWYKMVALVSCLWLKIWQFYLKLALKDLALNSASIFYFLDISSHVMELLGSTPVLMCIDSCALTRICPVTVVLL